MALDLDLGDLHGGEAGLVADRLEVRVVVATRRNGGRRRPRVPGARAPRPFAQPGLGAGEVVEQPARVAETRRPASSRSFASSNPPLCEEREDRRRSAPTAAAGMPDPAPRPTVRIRVPGSSADGADALHAPGRARRRSCPPARRVSSPSSVNVAWPSTTTYSSSWPELAISSWSPMISCCRRPRGGTGVDAERADPEVLAQRHASMTPSAGTRPSALHELGRALTSCSSALVEHDRVDALQRRRPAPRDSPVRPSESASSSPS